MENQELFKQAILDAKAVRETAMAAARTTLAEHFEPFIKESMAQSLSVEDDGMDEDMHDEAKHSAAHHMNEGEDQYYVHDKDGMEEPMGPFTLDQAKQKLAKLGGRDYKMIDAETAKEIWSHLEDDGMDEAALEEILAELDALSEDMEDEGLEEGHVKSDGYDGKAGKRGTGYDETAKVSHGDHKLHEAGHDLTKDMEAGEGGDDQEVVDITVGDLKDIIRDVFMQLQGGAMAPEAPLDADTDLAMDLGGEEDENISLDEILAELEAEEGKMKDEAKHMKDGAKVEEGTGPGGRINPHASDVNKVDYEEAKKDLNEAVKTIKALKTELNEINLFSAKLLYVNKIFKAKNLNESQKTKVINAFDRAISVKEVENTYKTLLESLTAETKKTSLKESVGFASKPIGNAPARPIVEADAFVSRWQTLAGIK